MFKAYEPGRALLLSPLAIGAGVSESRAIHAIEEDRR